MQLESRLRLESIEDDEREALRTAIEREKVDGDLMLAWYDRSTTCSCPLFFSSSLFLSTFFPRARSARGGGGG